MRKLERVARDFYPTEEKLVDLLLKHQAIKGSVLDPCAGDRRMMDTLRSSSSCVVSFGTDIADEDVCGLPTKDATQQEYWDYWRCVDWVVTNPPYNVAQEIIPKAYETAKHGVAMLMRLSYLEPCKGRAEWMKDHADNLSKIITVNPRPRYRSDTRGTDSVTSCWLVWDKTFSWESRDLPCPFIFENGWRGHNDRSNVCPPGSTEYR